MFLSFLVPNTMTTISSTISQCQMEKVPMKISCECWDSKGIDHPSPIGPDE
jgi:hypothetical protein